MGKVQGNKKNELSAACSFLWGEGGVFGLWRSPFKHTCIFVFLIKLSHLRWGTVSHYSPPNPRYVSLLSGMSPRTQLVTTQVMLFEIMKSLIQMKAIAAALYREASRLTNSIVL